MSKINSNKFNFSFFLSDRKKVKSLETGAKTFGGATKFQENTYSNIEGNEYVRVNNNNNQISIFIPSTNNVNTKADNTKYINYSINYLKRFFKLSDIQFYDTKGSWFSEDKKEVVIEDITIITLNINNITETDINIFIKLARYIKKEMSQEGVSIAINTALGII